MTLSRLRRCVNLSRLIYVATADHLYTLAPFPRLLAERGVRLSLWSWDRLFRQRSLPRATWILADFDRLSPSWLEPAGRVYTRLAGAGVRVLNDPRRFRNRAQLILALQAEGLIDYGCVLPANGAWPDSYPVFLRTIAAHRGILSSLIDSREQARGEIARALQEGFTLSDLMFVEYCAEPIAETGHFQKHSALRIGDAMVRANTVNDRSWVAKDGVPNLATPAHYAAERAEYANWPHRDYAARVFELAGMEFGRLDFGIARGRPQAYEINTNPTLPAGLKHANHDRRVTLRMYRDGIVDGLAALARRVEAPPVPIVGVFPAAPRAVFRRPWIY